MPGTQRSILYLETRFETGDIPTQQDFEDFFASFLHYTQVAQTTGVSETNVMSQKAVTDALGAVGAVWGAITGTVSDQADLATYITNQITAAVTGLYDDRGNYDPTATSTYPATGGSGAAGAILKGDIWRVSVSGTIAGTDVQADDTVRALVDAPGLTAANWAILTHAGGAGDPVVASQNISGAVVLDLATADVFLLTLTADVTSFSFINETPGKQYVFKFIQDTTNKAITWAAGKYRFPFGNAPVLTNPTTNGTASVHSEDIVTTLCSTAGRLDVVTTPNLIEN